MRDDEVALLERDGAFRLYLRGSHGQGTRQGRQALGPRVVSFDVGSASELDRVEERLRAHGSFRTRQSLSLHEDLEVVFGFDPDRLALTFATPRPADRMPSIASGRWKPSIRQTRSRPVLGATC